MSRRTAEKLRRFFVPDQLEIVDERMCIIPMGVDVAAFDDRGPQQKAHDREANRLGNEPAILFIGRLTEKKGIADLILAADLLRKQGLSFRLIVAGDGELRDSIGGQVRALGLDDIVTMPGYVGGELKRSLLSAVDILVVPSIVTAAGDAEGLPVSLLEGMAAGKYCIASDASGADDVMTDGEDGIIVPAADVTALARALSHALLLDPATREAMGKRAGLRAAEFDWPRIAERHVRHLFARIG